MLTLEVETWDTGLAHVGQWSKVREEVHEAQDEIYLLVAALEEGDWDEASVRIERAADELADVVQAACNMARVLGVDMADAMRRCTERQRARGRL